MTHQQLKEKIEAKIKDLESKAMTVGARGVGRSYNAGKYAAYAEILEDLTTMVDAEKSEYNFEFDALIPKLPKDTIINVEQNMPIVKPKLDEVIEQNDAIQRIFKVRLINDLISIDNRTFTELYSEKMRKRQLRK